MNHRRVILIVLDSVGVGQAPDAAAYGDEGANTLGHTAAAAGGLHVPNLARLGLGRITNILGVTEQEPAQVAGAYGYMVPQSAGKDTTNGHLEFVGVTLREPLPTYPNGFPAEIMRPFEAAIGRSTLGNRPASGTVILQELGEQHVQTGQPIVYTSADSVFQIAAHEKVIPVDELYRMCEIARGLLSGPHAVGRVIARPFVGVPGAYTRTANRRDYSRDFGPTLLTALSDSGVSVIGIGKIEDIYAGQGITQGVHTANNADGVVQTIKVMKAQVGPALIFTNLVDFDSLYGHRNDPIGFAKAIEAFDQSFPDILNALQEDDLLLITADHGCDPTTPSTDHSREGVPLLAYGKWMRSLTAIGRRDTYADLGATIARHLGIEWREGEDFYAQLGGTTL
ncbi:MAG: phosphopentomutase [Firmicutes bacterium]|nr:phosphopentomutase [Bacillota bacterium]